MKTYWMGKDVEEMTKEELIEALKTMGRMYNEHIEFTKHVNNIWREIVHASN